MRSTSLSSFGFLALAIGLPLACGGASNTDLLGGGHSSSSSSSSSSGGSSGGSSGSGSGSGSGSSSGSASSSGSGSGSSSGGDQDASMQDVSTVDVVQPMETGPMGPSVLCPMQGQPATCDQGDFCCVTGDAQLGTQMDNCEHMGTTCAGTPVRCASTADCPQGQTCCGQKDTTGMMYLEVGCKAQCTGTGQITFCDPAAMDCPSNAPTCQQSQLLQGYNVCQ